MRRNIVKKTETLLKFFSLITWFPFLSHTWEGGTDTGKRDHKTRKDFWYRRSFSWWSFAWKTAHWTICYFTDIHNHWGFFLAQVEKKMRNLWESNWNKQALKKDRRVALQAAESQSPSGFWLGFSLCVLLFCFVFFKMSPSLLDSSLSIAWLQIVLPWRHYFASGLLPVTDSQL